MRLIDVDALGVGRCSKDILPAAYCAGWNGMIGILEKADTVDAVVVTRCKDCKYYRNHPNGLCYLHTEPKENARGYAGDAVCVEPDDFCSYGEPKEGTHADDHD